MGSKNFFHQREKAERRIPEGEIEERGGSDQRTHVAECLETVVAVVVAHAAMAYAAKWQVRVGYVKEGVVDAAASGQGGSEDMASRGFFAKEVEGQRIFAPVDELNGFVQGIIRDDWQHRAKNFILHHPGIWRYLGQ